MNDRNLMAARMPLHANVRNGSKADISLKVGNGWKTDIGPKPPVAQKAVIRITKGPALPSSDSTLCIVAPQSPVNGWPQTSHSVIVSALWKLR